jgi:hypothetical protein
MKYLTLVTVVLVGVLIISPNYFAGPKFETPTGQLIYTPPYKESQDFSYSLDDWVNGFFRIRGLKWPKGSCTDVANQLFDFVIYSHLTVTEDFSTFGPERMSNVVYGLEQEHAGAIEMIYGKDLLKDYPGDSALHLYAESVVRIPHVDRASEMHLNLFGYSEDYFYVTHGRIVTPTLECDFTSKEGVATCECKYSHTAEYRY